MYFLPLSRNKDKHILVGNYFRNTQILYWTFVYRHVCYLNKWHLKSWNLLILIQHFKGINLIFNRKKNQSTFQKQQLMTQSSHTTHRNASNKVNIHACSIYNIHAYLLRIYCICGFGGLGVACWPFVPKFAGSNLVEAVGFVRNSRDVIFFLFLFPVLDPQTNTFHSNPFISQDKAWTFTPTQTDKTKKKKIIF